MRWMTCIMASAWLAGCATLPEHVRVEIGDRALEWERLCAKPEASKMAACTEEADGPRS